MSPTDARRSPTSAGRERGAHEPVAPPAAIGPDPWFAAFRRRQRRFWLSIGAAVLLGTLGVLGHVELRTSWLQSRLLTDLAQEASFITAPGPSPRIYFPDIAEAGPYDLRLGYARIPQFLTRLESRGYRLTRQARVSPAMLHYVERGIYPLYKEKSRTGLRILDRDGALVFDAPTPARAYLTYGDIPPLIVGTLLFLENRELLDSSRPLRNPAVEWDRLGRAVLHLGARYIDPSVSKLGGSTLATQLEKTRHSRNGVTSSVRDKLRQIATASLRAYLDGPTTLTAQERIVRDYLNSMPLAARAGHGEVIGLGDGLWFWYGRDFDQVNASLSPLTSLPADSNEREVARTFRQVVSLMVAIRRPTSYLVRNPDQLERDTQRALVALQRGGIITPRLARLAARTTPTISTVVRQRAAPDPARKPAATVRALLTRRLGLKSVYELDRSDLTVSTGIDRPLQLAVSRQLARLATPEHAAAAGITGDRMLGDDDPSTLIYSLVLYERRGDANVLRVRTDTLDQPFDVNTATKLELGSTAKLRTLVTYLELIAELYAQASVSTLDAPLDADDPITRWVGVQLGRHPDLDLPTLLERAMDRRYSARPDERFFTGGGLHRFSNFDRTDDHRVLSVREAFRRSVNLVFVRMMRDIVRFHVARLPYAGRDLWLDPANPMRPTLLRRHAERESVTYLDRFLVRHRGLSLENSLDLLASRHYGHPRRLGVIYRSVLPLADVGRFEQFVSGHLPFPLDSRRTTSLYAASADTRWSWSDRGYLSSTHPLELWLVRDLARHPEARRSEILARSTDVRRDVYRWLFRTPYASAQDRRIRTELERDAFIEIHRRWQHVGYPFDQLVPSYATALGSSGDTPAALAELLGIIQNGGQRAPSQLILELRFAEGTPYETWMEPGLRRVAPVINPEVAKVLRRELIGVVDHGTGRRVAGALTLDDGTALVIGGKTGTGDNRVRFRDGSTRHVLNRTATFAFLAGDRFHGAITAYVDGDAAADYRFTSALPVQVLKYLAPTLQPLLSRGPCPPFQSQAAIHCVAAGEGKGQTRTPAGGS